MHIKLIQIGKKFDRNWIFNHIDAELSSPGIYGLIGFNGSGKSTLLQIISGFVTPTNGEIIYHGGKTSVEDIYTHCSMAAPYMELPSEFTIIESIQLHEKFKPFRENWTAKSILTDLELDQHAHKTLDQLSSGMRQRLKLALAICSNSSLILLDEPCANLDSKWTAWYNDRLKSEAGGRLIVISSNSQELELRHVNKATINVSAHHPS